MNESAASEPVLTGGASAASMTRAGARRKAITTTVRMYLLSLLAFGPIPWPHERRHH